MVAFSVAGRGPGVCGGLSRAGRSRFPPASRLGVEASHLAGTDHSGHAGGVVMFDFGVSSVAPAFVEANESGSGEASGLAGWLLAPELLKGRDVLESQPMVHANTQALAVA